VLLTFWKTSDFNQPVRDSNNTIQNIVPYKMLRVHQHSDESLYFLMFIKNSLSLSRMVHIKYIPIIIC